MLCKGLAGFIAKNEGEGGWKTHHTKKQYIFCATNIRRILFLVSFRVSSFLFDGLYVDMMAPFPALISCILLRAIISHLVKFDSAKALGSKK